LKEILDVTVYTSLLHDDGDEKKKNIEFTRMGLVWNYKILNNKCLTIVIKNQDRYQLIVNQREQTKHDEIYFPDVEIKQAFLCFVISKNNQQVKKYYSFNITKILQSCVLSTWSCCYLYEFLLQYLMNQQKVFTVFQQQILCNYEIIDILLIWNNMKQSFLNCKVHSKLPRIFF